MARVVCIACARAIKGLLHEAEHGSFDYEFVAGGPASQGPLVVLRFTPFDVSSTTAVPASEHLMTAQEVDYRIGEIKASLDTAAAAAKAQLAASRSP